MIHLSGEFLFFVFFVCSGIGYTLLRYSRDGDMDLRVKKVTKFADASITTNYEAWDKLEKLLHADSTEVTWNTSMFVSIVTSFLFLGLLASEDGQPKNTVQKWFLVVLSVFFLQDLVIRWKAAHRKSAATFEKLSILERLRWSFVRDDLRINKTSWHEA
jgi:hypothetical protein